MRRIGKGRIVFRLFAQNFFGNVFMERPSGTPEDRSWLRTMDAPPISTNTSEQIHKHTRAANGLLEVRHGIRNSPDR
jgi:hypothetical protein